jgi:hypothetical protein
VYRKHEFQFTSVRRRAINSIYDCPLWDRRQLTIGVEANGYDCGTLVNGGVHVVPEERAPPVAKKILKEIIVPSVRDANISL